MSPHTTSGPIHSSLADDDLMVELVELFVGDIPDRIETLTRAFETGDLELLQRTAHQLKGAFGSYGFDQLTAPASELELVARAMATETEVERCLMALVADCRRMTAVPKL